jgi:hypothetical protein
VTLEEALLQTNRNLVVFDLILGTVAIAFPRLTLRAIGHEEPSEDAVHLFRRCGPIWLTFAAGHALAHHRGCREDWRVVAWLRGTEIGTDALWAQSPAISRPGAKLGLRLASVFNLVVAVGFGWMSRR